MTSTDENSRGGFSKFNIDNKILNAISQLDWKTPTPIQQSAIPLALEGKDLLAHARTGSGKTGAYVIPLLQKIIENVQMANKKSAFKNSVDSVIGLILAPTRELCSQATRDVKMLSRFTLESLNILNLSCIDDVDNRKKMIKFSPTIIVTTPSRIMGHLECGDLKLNKNLKIVVADEADLLFSLGYEEDIKIIRKHLPKSYQTFLLSATLDNNVDKFNLLMCTIPTILTIKQSNLPDPKLLSQYCINPKKNKANKKDFEYNISRGIDFQNVSNVINFDFPTTTTSYIHRVGRTARANTCGTAISLVDNFEQSTFEALESMFKTCGVEGLKCNPYNYKMSEVEGFRYRIEDALKNVTKIAIKNARLEEIEQEMINSKKLKNYFKENPRDFQSLRRDNISSRLKIQNHLKNVPDYLLPESLKIKVKKSNFKPKKGKKNTQV